MHFKETMNEHPPHESPLNLSLSCVCVILERNGYVFFFNVKDRKEVVVWIIAVLGPRLNAAGLGWARA